MLSETETSVARPLTAPNPKAQPNQGNKTATPKSTGKNTADRQQRLSMHLAIGLIMALAPLAGYVFFGPASRQASAQRLLNVAQITATSPQAQANGGIEAHLSAATAAGTEPSMPFAANDLAHIQAEMESITRRLDALRPDGPGVQNPPSAGIGVAPNGAVGSQEEAILSQLEEMNALLHQTINQLNNLQTQPKGATNPGGSSGHH